ncbi:cadmium resistance transporter [Periweissella fabaria]|uniref:Cadmium resistance transporter n=1 Tax=Periweissella fabaria TaxID=546157 RepID=A0ABM8Z3M7_9LACO|nr:cadmium resistance transporter [Periweissella fabaria]MCM0596395.1 cadmium resistance transporter [Periweissella fabaria]CAH0415877.1 hypothetical protein WFA24289_00175 [Periweissella fabaria]
MVQLIGLTIGIFITTNLDDLVMLLLLNEEVINRRLKLRELMYGQILGILIIGLISWLISLGVSHFVPGLTRWLGIFPLLIGLRMLINNIRSTTNEQTLRGQTSGWRNILAITALTLAGSADNLAVYIPVFQRETSQAVAAIVLMFIPLTVGWILLSVLIARIPPIKWALARYTDKLVPVIFMLLGGWILLDM